MRRDWRIGLGIRPDYDGFCPTVLVRFRQRLLSEGKARELFTTVLRRSRYRGAPKRALQAMLAATALNVRRLLRCLAAQNSPNDGLICLFLSLLQAAVRRAYEPIVPRRTRIGADQWQLWQIAFSHT